VLNALARSVAGLRRSDHVTTTLANFHGLRASERIQFKLVTLVYRSLHGLALRYLSDDLCRVADIKADETCGQRLRASWKCREPVSRLSMIELSALPDLDYGTVCRAISLNAKLLKLLNENLNIFSGL